MKSSTLLLLLSMCSHPEPPPPPPLCGTAVFDGPCSGHTARECFEARVCRTLVDRGCVDCHLTTASHWNWPNVPGARDLHSSVMAYGRGVLDMRNPASSVFLQKGFFSTHPDAPETRAALEWVECEANGGICR